MSRIFVSHSSTNNREAIALKQWLEGQNRRLANEIFLDLDPNPKAGIRTGERWAAALQRANARCEAVVCLISKQWESSVECLTEYRTAETLNKRVFIARLEPDAGKKTAAWQWCDLFGGDTENETTRIDIGDGDPVQFATQGLYRLRDGIHGAGIGADSFGWPGDDSDRAPYRGWLAFDPVDAGIFFGRDTEIVRAFDAVRGMRKARTKRWFVILGPSGSGKSSFLRAGLLPRLQRDDRDFLVLGIVRPEDHVLDGANGFAKAIFAARDDKGLIDPPPGDIEAACFEQPEQIRRLLGELQEAARAQQLNRGEGSAAPTLVLPLDQAEELLSSEGEQQAERFLQMVRDLVAPSEGDGLDMIVAATIRSDRFEGLQPRTELSDVGLEVFAELKPMPSEQFKEVIVGPAERVTEAGRPLQVESQLVDRLLAGCKEGSDTLPLLSLALSRLYEKYRSSGKLTLANYEKIGGLHRVVHSVIDSILDHDSVSRQSQLDLLRTAFIPWLATVNPDNDKPMRRVARWSDLPEASRPLICAFVENRLIVKDKRDDEDIVEVALESLLWQWDELAEWLNDHRADLKAADELKRADAAWKANGGRPDWLFSGSRLTATEALAATEGFDRLLAHTHAFLTASRAAEDSRLEVLKRSRRRFGLAPTSSIFVSCADEDLRSAVALKRWLQERNRSLKITLVTDPDVRRNGRQRFTDYDALICLVSRHSEGSDECALDHTMADAQHKDIHFARLDDSHVTVTSPWPRCDLFGGARTTPIDIGNGPPVILATDGLERLFDAVSGDISPGSFPWPPPDDRDRAPYRGWEPLQLEDAGVFFGRDAAVASALDAVHQMRMSGQKALLVVLGAPGIGKSAFVRAGLLPRLARQRRAFIVLDTVEPLLDPLKGGEALGRAVHRLRWKFGLAEPALDDILSACRQGDAASLAGWLSEVRATLAEGSLDKTTVDSPIPPTLVLSIDQGEDLLLGQDHILELVSGLVRHSQGSALIVVTTMRNDTYDQMQTHPHLTDIEQRIHEIRRLNAEALRVAIEGPAECAGLCFDEELFTRLVTDTGTGDALPLLAFTLEQLAHGVSRGGRLTHRRYEDIGGVQGALQRQADEALEAACSSTGMARNQVVSELLNLVTIDDQGRPSKRRLVFDGSSDHEECLKPFLERRLLSTEAAGKTTLITVSHDAFLVNWPPLNKEIDATVIALRTRRVVETAARDWEANERDAAMLLQGPQLAKAIVDTGADFEPVREGESTSDGHLWRLNVPRWRERRRLTTRVDLDDSARDFLEASAAADRARRARAKQKTVALIAVLAVAAATALVGFVQATEVRQQQAQANARQATASRLLTEAADMLSQNRPGGDVQALQQLIAAYALAPDTTAGALRLASASGDKTVRISPAVATPQMLCDKLTANMSRKQWREWISPDPDIGYRELCPGLPVPAE